MKVAPEGFEPVRVGGAAVGWQLGPRNPSAASPWVLLPGIEGDARVFARQVALSRQRAVYALDLPHGGSLAEMAEQLEGRLDQLGLARVALIGCSLGGLLGRMLAARSPLRVVGLVTFGSLPARECLPARVTLGRRLVACVPSSLFRLQYQRRIAQRLTAEGVPEPLRILLTSALPERDVLLERLRAIEDWGIPEAIVVPTLWLRGATDDEAPWDAVDVKRHLPGVSFETIPGGHRAPLTHSDAFHTSLQGFLGIRT